MTVMTMNEARDEVASLILTPDCDSDRLTELMGSNKKARDYVLYLASTASTTSPEAYEVLGKNLAKAYKNLDSKSPVEKSTVAVVTAMALWVKDEKDKDINLLLGYAIDANPADSLLQLCMKGRAMSLPSSAIRTICDEAGKEDDDQAEAERQA